MSNHSKIRSFFRHHNSIALKLVLGILLATVLTIIFFEHFIQKTVEKHFEELDIAELQTTINAIKQNAPEHFDQRWAEECAKIILSAHPGVFILITDQTGKVLYFSEAKNPTLKSTVQQHLPLPKANAKEQAMVWQAGNSNYRVLSDFLDFHQDKVTISTGVNIDFHQHYLHQFKQDLWLSAFLACIAMGLGIGWFIVTIILKPLNKMSVKLENITQEKLSTRIEPTTVPLELQGLVQSFNIMLNQLEEAFEKQKSFSADIAHELKTPITNLSTQTHYLLANQRNTQEYLDNLYSNLEEYEKITRMINDMLLLASTETGKISINETVDLYQELSALADYFDVLIEEAEISIQIEKNPSDCVISGNRELIRRALSNLLLNAIKYACKATIIQIQLKSENDQIQLVITNELIHIITEDQLERLFDRFYRVDSCRARKSGGTGIGLTIVKSIVKAHSGDINVHCHEGKISFTLIFPAQSARIPEHP